MGTIPRIEIVLSQHMSIKNQIKMKKQNIGVTLFAFHKSEAHQTCYEDNLQEKVSTRFLGKRRHCDNFCSMVNLRKQIGGKMFVTKYRV